MIRQPPRVSRTAPSVPYPTPFRSRRAVDHCGADALFVGAGGDNVFYLTHSARPLVDRFNTEGWSRGTFTTLHDICSITGASVWQVVFEAVRLSRLQNSRADWKIGRATCRERVCRYV